MSGFLEFGEATYCACNYDCRCSMVNITKGGKSAGYIRCRITGPARYTPDEADEDEDDCFTLTASQMRHIAQQMDALQAAREAHKADEGWGGR